MENINKKRLVMAYTSQSIEKITGIMSKSNILISDYRICRNSTIVAIENVVQTIHEIPVQYYHDPRTNYSSIKFSSWISSHRESLLSSDKERFLSRIWINILQSFDEFIDAELQYQDNQTDDIIIGQSYHPYYGHYIEKLDIFVQLLSNIQIITSECLYGNQSILDYYKKIVEMSSLQKGKDPYFHKKLKYIKTVKEQISILKDSQSVSMFGYQLEDDIVINNICKIAYVLLTGSSDLKHTGKVEEGLCLSDKDGIARVVKRLGYDIRNQIGCMDNLCRSSMPFNAFVEARTKAKFSIRSEFEYDMDFKLGCVALNYMAFIVDSPDINGILNRMGD